MFYPRSCERGFFYQTWYHMTKYTNLYFIFGDNVHDIFI